MPTPTTTRAFVVFSRKSSGKQIHPKPLGLKNVFKVYPGYEAANIFFEIS